MNLLVISVLLPLAGAVAITALSRFGPAMARRLALTTSLVTLALVTRVMLDFLADGVGKSLEVRWDWFSHSSIHIQFGMGIDGLSLWLYGLTALLTITAVLISWESIADRPAAYYSLLLLLETGMLGVFVARDIILFYVFFEFTLVPLFFIIGIWGSEDRRYAAVKFFLFTLAGSLLTFLGLLTIVLLNYFATPGGVLTFSIPELTASLAAHPIAPAVQVWIFVALFAGFAIKVPLFPLHTWLPLAHVQAPAAGSVILAGILLKLGTYGFLRFNLPMLPDGTVVCMPWVLWLAAAGIIYGALVSLAQNDIKKLIAYSSVSHMGFCMLGIFAITPLGLGGGTLQMLNHGLSTGGLFALVGMLYERYHTRQIADYRGIARKLPIFSTMFVIFTLSSIGLPGLNGFAGEFLLLTGMFQRGWAEAPFFYTVQWQAISIISTFGVVLGAWYMLWLVQRVFFGPLKEKEQHGHHEPIRDLSIREVLALAPLLVFMFWIGLVPQHFLAPMNNQLRSLAAGATASFDQHYLAAPAQRPEPASPIVSTTQSGEFVRVD
jgi:NADH-quinone oxidoreductase subunit M